MCSVVRGARRSMCTVGTPRRVRSPALTLMSIAVRSASSAGGNAAGNSGPTRWGPVCIPEGERYAIWNRFSGACQQIHGPQWCWSMGSRVDPLQLYSAGPEQYIKVALRDGSVEYVRGPASLWQDPLHHASVEVLQAMQVGSDEAVIIYREVAAGAGRREIQRSVLRGPAIYAPNALEWLHSFSWHGTDRDTLKSRVQRKLPGLLRFHKVRLTPDQIYFDIPDVRSRDDALITVKLTAFLKIVDLEAMVNNTHDPVSEFMNSLSADVMDFAGSRTFEQFKGELEQLNLLHTYPSLVGRVRATGFDLSKIVFRGYIASDRLQEMHDESIYKRTELVLQKETQEQEQDLKDFKLDRDSSRAERLADFKLARAQERQTMDKERAEHQEQINDVEAKASLQRGLLAHEQGVALEDTLHSQKIRHEQAVHARMENHYSALHKLGVDLSRYLVVVARGAPHRVIEIDNNGMARQDAAHVHVHSEDKTA